MNKRLKRLKNLVDDKKFYELEEAVKKIKELAEVSVKFDETVDIAINLGINPKLQDQRVRSNVVLPYGTGKELRICVFAKGEYAKQAEDAGAHIVGDKELIEEIKQGRLDFDAVLATPDIMREVSQLGKILGPRGLMPSPKLGSVTFQLKDQIGELKKGRIDFKSDQYGIVHSRVGKVSFSEEKLIENIKTFIAAVIRAKPDTAKGSYIKRITLSTTMGVGIKLSTKIIRKLF